MCREICVCMCVCHCLLYCLCSSETLPDEKEFVVVTGEEEQEETEGGLFLHKFIVIENHFVYL